MKHFLIGLIYVSIGVLLMLWIGYTPEQNQRCETVLKLDETDHAVKSATIKTLMENYDRVIKRNEQLRIQLANSKALDKVQAQVESIHTLVEKAHPVEAAVKQEATENHEFIPAAFRSYWGKVLASGLMRK